MTRIVHVLATLKRAGAETMVSSLVSRLDRAQFDPVIVTLFDESPNDLAAEVNVPVHRLGKRPGLDLRMYGRLQRALRSLKPDIVHTHSYVLRYVLPVARCRVVHTVHNLAYGEVDVVGRLLHRIAFRFGVTPVAVSNEVGRSFEKMYGFKAEVIPNGVDLSRFQLSAPPPAPDQFTVLSVARLDPQKNPVLLADACAALDPPVRLRIAGQGSLRPLLQDRSGVELLGVRSDVAELMRDADVFALSSDYEGHPIALIEAMAAGMPVVVTSVGGVPEIVGDAGLLVPPGDRNALTEALRRLQHDPRLRAELSRRARAQAAQFDVARMVASYSSLYRRVARVR